ncbi:hypothetical protein VAB18032_05065 [Micromonospora maris AB-18-032]|nr:hypothetical protein VAB18032_05065 [Micromonospora maris AB-18-032]
MSALPRDEPTAAGTEVSLDALGKASARTRRERL